MDNAAALGEVDRQRRNAAARLRVPGWYLVLYAAGCAGMLAAPVIGTGYGAGIAMVVLQLFGVVTVSSPAFLLPRITGLRLPHRTASVYPSILRTIPLLVGALAGGVALTLPLMLSGRLEAALVVSGLTGILAALALRHAYRRIAEDIATGNVRS